MSFDLFFYKRKGTTMTKEDIDKYLYETHGIPNEYNSNQWSYYNEKSAVNFDFDYDLSSIEDAENYEEFENTGLIFNINYNVPDIYGHEAFPLVTKLVDDLDLFIVNPQFGAETDEPHRPSAESLYKLWFAINSRNYPQM